MYFMPNSHHQDKSYDVCFIENFSADKCCSYLPYT